MWQSGHHEARPGAVTLAEALLHDVRFVFVVPHWAARHMRQHVILPTTPRVRVSQVMRSAQGVDSGRHRGLSARGWWIGRRLGGYRSSLSVREACLGATRACHH